MRRLSVLTWRRRVAAASILACAAALAFKSRVRSQTRATRSRHDQGHAVDNGTTVTIYCEASGTGCPMGRDCNFDRAATGVGIIWNDFNGSQVATVQRGTNEVQRIALSGTLANAHFTLTWKNPAGTNRTSAVISSSDSAATLSTRSSRRWPASVRATSTSPAAPATTPLGRRVHRSARADERQRDDGGEQERRPDSHDHATTRRPPTRSTTAPRLERRRSRLRRLQDADGSGTRQDQMVHPVDRGNQAESYRTSGTDYPANQTFFDPSPPNTGRHGRRGRAAAAASR